MVYNKYDSSSDDENQKLLFDLRQSWANGIDSYMKIMRTYKLAYNLKGWHDILIFMSPSVFSRVKRNRNQTFKEYKELKNKVNEIINKYKNTYLGKDREPEGMEKITNVLSEMEFFLGEVIESNNMYGTKINESVI